MRWWQASGLLVAGVLATGIAGCRQSEQDRPLRFQQGQYQGQPDEKLSDNQVKELQQRGNLMR